jgi:hypothetical protein
MVSTRNNNYNTAPTIIKNKMSHHYNLRSISQKNTKSKDISAINEVQNYISEIKAPKYNLRSTTQQTPRINYYRFYTSRPDTHTQYLHIRRSPRIQSMTTPRPNYVDEY